MQKKVFLILVSNGQMNGKVMKYAFFKFLSLDYTIKLVVENASGC